MTRLLLASDFDGTLSAIVDEPSDATLHSSARELLAAAASNKSLTIALVSGRDVEDLAARAGLENIWYAGSHGREVRRPDGSWLVSEPPLAARPEPELISRLRERGFRIEEKKFGLAIHWRSLPHVDDDDPLIREFRAWADAAGLELIRGRRVAEARAAGADKREALERIAEEISPARVVFAGDDLTDFAALDWASSRGRALFITSPEREPPHIRGLDLVGSLDELLDAFREELTALS